jgi:hypothetical protein
VSAKALEEAKELNSSSSGASTWGTERHQEDWVSVFRIWKSSIDRQEGGPVRHGDQGCNPESLWMPGLLYEALKELRGRIRRGMAHGGIRAFRHKGREGRKVRRIGPGRVTPAPTNGSENTSLGCAEKAQLESRGVRGHVPFNAGPPEHAKNGRRKSEMRNDAPSDNARRHRSLAECRP